MTYKDLLTRLADIATGWDINQDGIMQAHEYQWCESQVELIHLDNSIWKLIDDYKLSQLTSAVLLTLCNTRLALLGGNQPLRLVS